MKNVSHVKEDYFGKTKSFNGVDIYDRARFFLSEEWKKSGIILVF